MSRIVKLRAIQEMVASTGQGNWVTICHTTHIYMNALSVSQKPSHGILSYFGHLQSYLKL